MFRCSLTVLTLACLSCTGTPGDEPQAVATPANEKCPNVHIDKLATDWIIATGDPKNRMRILETETGYTAWLTDGFFTKREYVGTKRADDVRFTEVPTGKRKQRIDNDEENRIRFYAKPTLRKCAIQVFFGVVNNAGTEQIAPTAKEYLAFPESPAVFSFQPPGEPLFLGKAATNKNLADKELADAGEASGYHEFGTIPVGAWSTVSADGDPSCQYEMDLFFDGRLIENGSGVTGTEVNGDLRHWTYTWEAPYSGNHNFEMYRYRKCGDERTLLGIASNLATLG